MRSCSLLFAAFLLLLFAAGVEAADPHAEFLAAHRVAEASPLGRDMSSRAELLKNRGWLFSMVRVQKAPRIMAEEKRLCLVAEQGLRDALYLAAAGASPLRRPAALAAFRSIAGKDASLLQGVEFSTSRANGFTVLYAIPSDGRIKKARGIIASPAFRNAYRSSLRSMAAQQCGGDIADLRSALDKRKTFAPCAEAEPLMREVLDMGESTPADELLHGKCLVSAGRRTEAERLAERHFASLASLDAQAAEDLGDLLFALGREEEAGKAWNAAADKL